MSTRLTSFFDQKREVIERSRERWLRFAAVSLVMISLVSTGLAQQPSSQVAGRAAKYKHKIERLGVGHSILVETRTKDTTAGHIAEITDSVVVIDEVDQKSKVRVAYTDITYVEGNYGGVGIHGRRVRALRSHIIVAAFAGFIAVLVIALATAKD